MRVGLGQFNELTDEMCQFIKQMGCDDFLMNTPKLPGDTGCWQVEDLAALKTKADEYDLRLMALENVPIPFYLDIMLGGDRRQAQLDVDRAALTGHERHLPLVGFESRERNADRVDAGGQSEKLILPAYVGLAHAGGPQ